MAVAEASFAELMAQGEDADDAEMARFIEKVLKSAVANAEDRGVRNPDRLRIVEARVDGGPMFKRVQPRARGMAFLIRRRTAHIHVAVEAPELG